MGVARQLGLLAIGAALLCLPGRAESQVYAVRVPGADAAARVEARVAYRAGWDVRVTFDAASCEFFCEYRRRPDAFGLLPLTDLLLPPVTELWMVPESGPATRMAVIDPAGLRYPGLDRKQAPGFEPLYLAGRRLSAAAPRATGAARLPLVTGSRAAAACELADTNVPAALPLRI